MLDTVLDILMLAIFLFVIIYNAIYWVKVLPTLERSGESGVPKLLPSGQFRDFTEYASLLKQAGDRPLSYYFALACKPLSLVLAVAFIAALLWEVLDGV